MKAYREAVAHYHLHPEAKFLGGDYGDVGVTARRHVTAAMVTYIGKEANEWERQLYLGSDDNAAIAYGPDPATGARLRKRTLEELNKRGVRELGRTSGVSAAEISSFRHGRRNPQPSVLLRLLRSS